MANTIKAIPVKTRWELATKGLTGAYIAISNALKQAVGQKGFEEFNGSLWYEAGKGAKEFAKTFGLATKTAGDLEEVTHLMASASMGPEFVFEIVESTKDRCVGKTTHCPWHKRWKEQGLDMDTCGVGHQRWGDGAVESLNPNFTFKLTKNMLHGDSHCEWVVERKKKSASAPHQSHHFWTRGRFGKYSPGVRWRNPCARVTGSCYRSTNSCAPWDSE